MTIQTDILSFLKNLVIEMKDIEEEAVKGNSSFEDLELDSLDFVEVQVGVKKHYGVDLTPDLFASGTINNLDQLSGYIADESTAAVGQ